MRIETLVIYSNTMVHTWAVCNYGGNHKPTLSVLYLYHCRDKPSFHQTQQRIYDLEYRHHLTEVHHISHGVEGVIERVCGG